MPLDGLIFEPVEMELVSKTQKTSSTQIRRRLKQEHESPKEFIEQHFVSNKTDIASNGNFIVDHVFRKAFSNDHDRLQNIMYEYAGKGEKYYENPTMTTREHTKSANHHCTCIIL